MAQELAALDPVTFGSQAIAIAERSAALLPGYRDPQEQLALTLLVAGEYQRAIEMADMARGLATRTDLDGVYLNYITAKALLRLGRADEAGALINAIAASEYADAAVLKQDLRQVE
jgi:tetratricopeptide (TPR) repeat protein